MVNVRKIEMDIDLQKLLLAYLRKWWLILLCVIIGGVAAWVYTTNFITPMYRASVTIYVNNIRNDQDIQYVSGGNLSTSKQLVSTYTNIIKSHTVLTKIANEANIRVSPGALSGMMSTSQVGDTEMFNIIITHADPTTAARVANAVAEVAPKEIAKIVEGSSTKIIDYARVPGAPSSPNKKNNTTKGIFAGAIVALAYITLRFFMDMRIRDEEDLTSLFGMPVLAQIPAFVPDSENSGGYSNGKYGYQNAGYVRDEDAADKKKEGAGK